MHTHSDTHAYCAVHVNMHTHSHFHTFIHIGENSVPTELSELELGSLSTMEHESHIKFGFGSWLIVTGNKWPQRGPKMKKRKL